jgi:hypothetical protein
MEVKLSSGPPARLGLPELLELELSGLFLSTFLDTVLILFFTSSKKPALAFVTQIDSANPINMDTFVNFIIIFPLVFMNALGNYIEFKPTIVKISYFSMNAVLYLAVSLVQLSRHKKQCLNMLR